VNQKGLAPIIIFFIAILIAGAVIVGFYAKQRFATPESTSLASPVPQSSNSPSPTPASQIRTNSTPAPKPTATPTSSATPAPTPVPASSPAPLTTPAPAPKSSCGINVQAVPMDSNSTFDSLLTLQLTYSAISTSGKYMTGAQWDFDNDNNWDTDITQANGSIVHTFPGNGNYNVRLQLKMSDGEITPVCSKTVTVPMGITVRLTGQVFRDINCNGAQEPGEEGIAEVTINVLRMPEFTAYTTLTSDSSGYYNLTRIIGSQDNLTIQPSDIATPGYKINVHGTTVTLNSNQTSLNQNLPQVPAENIGLCGPVH